MRNFAAGDGHRLLRSHTTTYLSHIGTYSWPDTAIATCDRRPQGFLSLKSLLPPGHLVTLVQAANPLLMVGERSNIILLTNKGGSSKSDDYVILGERGS